MDNEGEKLIDELTDELAIKQLEIAGLKGVIAELKLETVQQANKLVHWRDRALDAEDKNRRSL